MATDPVLALGKLPPALLAELLGDLPPAPPEVRVGPSPGEDACAIEVPAGTLVATTDPITLTGHDVARYAVAINANDVAAMGVAPRWFQAAVLLPRGTVESEVRTLFAALLSALAEVGAVLVGGHTEVTGAVVQPTIVGQMLGFSTEGRLLSSAGLRPGDRVLQLGAAPIEAASVLAQEGGRALSRVDPSVLAAARDAVHDPGISVVPLGLVSIVMPGSVQADSGVGGGGSLRPHPVSGQIVRTLTVNRLPLATLSFSNSL